MEFQIGQMFRGRWFEGIATIEGVDKQNNVLSIRIDRANEQWHFEEWNLIHTISGFEQGDYYSIYAPNQ